MNHICKFCNKEYSTGPSLGGHVIRCKSNPKKLIEKIVFGRRHTEDTKKKLSSIRSKYLNDNPDKTLNTYLKSKAEKDFGELLKKWNIDYKPQFNDKAWKRAFRVDFYLTKHQVGIEVNGNFKYSDNKLTQYYLDRQALILERSGLRLYNIRYYDVYNVSEKDLIESLQNEFGTSKFHR